MNYFKQLIYNCNNQLSGQRVYVTFKLFNT